MFKYLLLPAALLALSLACSSGSEPAAKPLVAATGITYTDPVSTGWRLVKDPASTPTRLLLNLVGPSGLKTRGVGFNLQLPANLKAGNFTESGFPIRDLGVYELFNSDPYPYDGSVVPGSDPLEPKLLAGGMKAGNLLTVGIFQKDRRLSAKDSGVPLCQIALETASLSGLNAGDPLKGLVITKARYVAEDVGAFDVAPTAEMARKARMVDATVALGTLTAR
ncbi:MAG TPA: hypothetical protein VK188_12170 [Holophaga sp.]|nr:hypothetical protein [Holophaga sp.]